MLDFKNIFKQEEDEVEFEIDFGHPDTIIGILDANTVDDFVPDIDWEFRGNTDIHFPSNKFDFIEEQEMHQKFLEVYYEINEKWDMFLQWLWDYKDEYKEVEFMNFKLYINPELK